MKNISYIVECFALYVLFFIFRAMPVDCASAVGGWVGRSVGPCLATSRKARRNIEGALPDLEAAHYDQIIRDMWDNLGRIIAEYPHLDYISRHRTSFEHMDLVTGKTGIFIGAHMGNWEVFTPAVTVQHGVALHLTYRALNNPWADKLLHSARTLKGRIKAYAKSRRAGRDIFRALKEGNFVGILIDQKYNEGVSVNFFGKPAMTNPAFVQLAQKFKCPVIPVRGERLGGAHFKMTIHEPLAVFDDEGGARPVEDVIVEAHTIFENWIAQRPGQWLWLHRRWDSKQLSDIS